jgi:hypothetical protein
MKGLIDRTMREILSNNDGKVIDHALPKKRDSLTDTEVEI